MSREHRHAKRPRRAHPVAQLEAPAPEEASPTPHMAAVGGIARAPRPSTTADPLGGTAAQADVVNALRRRRGGGSPLPDDVAQRFGEQLGTDLSGVRVHTDPEADTISRSVGAHAFTHGTDVYFSKGAYDARGSGQRVLAHELAHVAQNAAGAFRGSGAATEIGRADDPAEQDADRTADQLMSALRRSPAAEPAHDERAEVDESAAAAIRRLSVAQLRKVHEEAIAAIAESAARDKRRGGAPAAAGNGAAAAGGGSAPQPVADGGSHYEPYAAEPEEEPAKADAGSHYEPYAAEPDAEGGSHYEPYAAEPDAEGGSHYEPYAAEPEEEPAKAEGGSHYAAAPDLEAAGGQKHYDEVDLRGAGGGSHYEPYAAQPGAEPAKPGVGSHYAAAPDLEAAGGQKVYDEVDLRGAGGGSGPAGGGGGGGGGAAASGGGGGGEPQAADLQLSKRIDEIEKADQEQAAAAEGGAAAAVKPARTRGESSPHKAWLLARIDPHYADERGQSKKDLMAAITMHLTRIKAYWDALDLIHQLGPHDAPAYQTKADETLKQVLTTIAGAGPIGKAFSDRAKTLPLDELTLKLEAEHARCKDWLLREDLPIQNDGTLNLPKDASGAYDASSRVVKYNEGEEQEATKVRFSGGLLKRAPTWKPSPGPDGADPGQGGAVPVDTDKSVTHFTGPGYEIFVAGEDGQIYMTSHKIGVQHHSSLLAGADVAIGGEMKVTQGHIVEMSNKSGHYLPTVDSLRQFLHWLDKDGIPLTFKVSGFGVPPGSTGERLLSGADAQGNVDPKKSYEVLKTNAVMRALIEEYTQQRVEQVLAEEGLTVANGKVTTRENKEITPKEFRQILQKKLGKPKRTVSHGKFVGGKPEHTRSWKA